MNILYIAYSCNPYQGSEDQIGWKVPYEISKHNLKNQVYVITKEEQRPFVEKHLQEHPQENIHFYYVDIPRIFKKIYNGFLYSGRLNIWHRYAFPIAKEICRKYSISIIHQITPIEFRAIGAYGSIPNVKFVCGPLGGGEFVPKELRHYAARHNITEIIRRAVNVLSKIKLKLTASLDNCDCVIFANAETRSFVCPESSNVEYIVMPEIGIALCGNENQIYKSLCRKKCTFLIAGRMVYRKGHAFLLDALVGMPENLDYECIIVGDGPEWVGLQQRCKVNKKLSEHVVFKGKVSYEQMKREYVNADVLIMPSIRETTGTVILEAMSYGLPVITVKRFGALNLLDDSTGWLYDGSSKESYIDNLRQAIIDCITKPEEVVRRGKNARLRANDFSWENKVQFYQSIYNTINNSL